MYLHNLSIVFLTLFTSFLLLVPTVELASFSASTHCLEEFALLRIITANQVRFFLNHFLYQKKTHRQTQKASMGSHDTFILLK